MIRQPDDVDEGARWAYEARRQRGPVEIASACSRGPASRVDLAVRVVRGRNLCISPMVGAASEFS